MNRFFWPIGAWCLLALAFLSIRVDAFAADPGSGLEAAFGSGSSRKPSPGEWLEYLVAYPADPLENELRPDPAPALPANADDADNFVALDDETFIVKPSFEPAAAWRALPLRLEIIRPDNDGLRARMTFEGESREVLLPFTAPKIASEFHYEEPQPATERAVHRIGDRVYEVEATRRPAEQYGFVRYEHAELPFGLARFATESVDLILVGMGSGPPPPFPLRLREPVQPPPGRLFAQGAGGGE